MTGRPTILAAGTTGEPPPRATGARAWTIGVLACLVYIAVAVGGLQFALYSPQVTPVWLPTGVALGTLLLFGRRMWPAIFIGATVANITRLEFPPDASPAAVSALLFSAAVVGTGNTLEALVAEWICRRVFRVRAALDRVRDAVGVLLVASPVAPLVSATFGAGSLALSGRIEADAFWSVWFVWYVGNLIGFLVATPIIATWGAKRSPHITSAHIAEWVLLLTALLGAILISFHSPIGNSRQMLLSLAFLPLAVIAVGAIRLGPRGSATMVGILTAGSAAGTIAELGPFGMPTVHDSLLTLWIYIGVAAVMAGLLASMSAERESVLRAVEESDRRLRHMGEHVDAVYWVLDVRNDAIEYLSDAFERVWGRPQSACRTRSQWIATVHPEDRGNVTSAATYRDVPHEATYRVFGRSGMTRWIHERTFQMPPDLDGQPRLGGVAADVTVLIEAEEQRRAIEAREEQARKLESLGVMAGGIAHDFNNLLVAVIGNARMIANDAQTPATREAAHKIIQTAQHAADLTRQMLTTSGRGQVRREKIDLEELVRECIPLIVPEPDLTRITIERIGPTRPELLADATQIRQVLLNLITNAIEASDSSDGIAVRVGTCRMEDESLDGCVPASRAEPGDFVFLEVADRGCGMSIQTQQRMFDPFFSTKFTGRGLGMAAVLGIVNAHRGAILVTSEEGTGTSVRVLLPMDAAAAPARELPVESSAKRTEPAPYAPPTAQGRSVLVVDDEPLVRDLALKVLKLAGLHARGARDGKAAIDLIRSSQEEFGAVLLDLTMPGLTGEQTLERIRELRPDLRVVVTTGNPEHAMISRLTSDPRVGFIAKPYSVEDLVARMRQELTADHERV